MARTGNSYRSYDPWRDLTGKDEPRGKGLVVTFHASSDVKSLAAVPAFMYKPEALMDFLEPRLRERHAFTPSDLTLIERALAAGLKHPELPNERKEALMVRLAAYRSSAATPSETAAPAVTAQ